jgi:hypothetical protein
VSIPARRAVTMIGGWRAGLVIINGGGCAGVVGEVVARRAGFVLVWGMGGGTVTCK